MDKDLTILVMTYNRFVYTKYTLDALALYTDFSCVKEVLIGDAGSTDGTRELVEQYEFVDRVYEVPHGNVAVNIKRGAELSRGKYVIILGNDMAVAQDWNRKALLALKAAEEHGIWMLGYDMPDNALNEAIYGTPERYLPGLQPPYQYRGPIKLNGFEIHPSWQVGGLWITSRKLLLSANPVGNLGDIDSHIYFGFWFWHLGFRGCLGVMLPRTGTLLMEFGRDLPSGLQYTADRLKEPLIQRLLDEDPVALKEEYIEKGWMRDLDYEE